VSVCEMCRRGWGAGRGGEVGGNYLLLGRMSSPVEKMLLKSVKIDILSRLRVRPNNS
jgi:hypothetical protein